MADTPRTLRSRFYAIVTATLLSAGARQSLSAQSPLAPSPFLFATVPATARAVTTFDAGYNARAFEPVAGERFESRASALVSLSQRVAVRAELTGASTVDHESRLAGQAEAIVTPYRRGSFSVSAAGGMRHEYAGTNVGLARVVAARVSGQSALSADLLLEHPYATGRDAVDVITTFGAMRAVAPAVWLGVEAVGSDLEGFIESDEAEGGATILIGPTAAVAIADRWRLVIGGGPVLRATTSHPNIAPITPDPLFVAPRAGYVIRTSLRLAW
jgi:hypothetical protein